MRTIIVKKAVGETVKIEIDGVVRTFRKVFEKPKGEVVARVVTKTLPLNAAPRKKYPQPSTWVKMGTQGHHLRKAVVCDGVTYISTTDAARKLGINRSQISKMLNGLVDTAGGKTFQFA